MRKYMKLQFNNHCTVVLCIALVLMLIQPFAGELKFLQAKQVYTMTYLMNHTKLISKLPDGVTVTVSTAKELFDTEYLRLRGLYKQVNIQQTADIVVSDYDFDYDEKSKRIKIQEDGNLLGAVDLNGNLYKNTISDSKITRQSMQMDTYKILSWDSLDHGGTYDGGGHKIIGMWNIYQEGYGCFGSYFKGDVTSGTEIRNVILEGGLRMADSTVGGIATCNSGRIINCKVNQLFVARGTNQGSIVETNKNYIYNCCFSGKIVSAEESNLVGGIAGTNAADGRISCCLVKKEAENKIEGSANAGGIAGHNEGSIMYCANELDIAASGDAGGIVSENKENVGKVLHCINYGNVSSPNISGGICATSDDVKICSCVNYGNVTSDNLAAGITGSVEYANTLSIFNCGNYGNISGTVSGGMLADGPNETRVTDFPITACFNVGEITGDTVGELVAMENACPVIYNNCFLREQMNRSFCDTMNGFLLSYDKEKKSHAFLWKMDGTGKGVLSYTRADGAFVPEEGYIERKIALVTTPPDVNPGYTNTPIPETTVLPVETAETIEQTPLPGVAPVTNEDNKFTNSKYNVKNFKVKGVSNTKCELQFQTQVEAGYYEIYRSSKKNSGWKKLKTISGIKQSTITLYDKTIKKGSVYYYSMRAFYEGGDGFVAGNKTASYKISVPYYASPVLTLHKGKTRLHKKCINLKVKKSVGDKVEFYIRQSGKKYTKLKLEDNSIRKNGGVFKLTYTKHNVTLYVKARTYKFKEGETRYSGYSDEKKIQI